MGYQYGSKNSGHVLKIYDRKRNFVDGNLFFKKNEVIFSCFFLQPFVFECSALTQEVLIEVAFFVSQESKIIKN